ncbi:hypothetical protein [Pontimicrobium sp. SW4]|uniref:DinB family protein n=1 Tax=Pontimicrobium sp. SW4 TaxID=3153519 RepID=A0AAU7BQ63_9FLAO
MKIKSSLLIVCLLIVDLISAQTEKLPYYEIPDYPSEYNEGTVVARLIDGLGFRYYWATEGLRAEDLEFKPSAEGRTTDETIDHIYGLTKTIINSALKKPNIPIEEPKMTFAEKRAKTLNLLKQAADIFRESNDLSEFTMVFQRGSNTTEYPFWNQINGPISDALWHVGQVITHRRTSGNPFNSKVSVLAGKVRD